MDTDDKTKLSYHDKEKQTMKRILAALVGVLLCAVALLACTSCGTPKLSYEEQKTAYDGIIAEYTALLTAKQNGETLTPPDTTGMSEGEAAISEAVYTAVNITNFPEDMAYTYWDMDGNGTLESKASSAAMVMASSENLPAGYSRTLSKCARAVCASFFS